MILWDGSTGSGVELTVRSKIAVSDASIGCSIAVNGVCLTATSFDLEKVYTYTTHKNNVNLNNSILKMISKLFIKINIVPH